MHAPARPVAQPRLERLAVLVAELDRHVHLGRRLAVRVELLQRGGEHLGRRTVDARPGPGPPPGPSASLPVVGQLDPIDDAAVPHLEDLDDGARRADLEAERVAVAQRRRLHLLLAVAQRLDRADRVAQVRRALELLVARRLDHLRAQALDELVLLAFEQQPRLVDGVAVLLDRADRLDARRDAALDVVFEARPVALAVDDLVARPDAEQPVRQRHRPARQRRRHERARRRRCRRARRGARPARAARARWS